MFENYVSMSASEKSVVKAIHKAAREYTHSRYGNLAWGFLRGFPYRRIERATYVQKMADGTTVSHNPARVYHLETVLKAIYKDAGVPYEALPLQAWLDNEEGAIPAPAPRPKSVYVPKVA